MKTLTRYFNLLGWKESPSFLLKYLEVPSLQRLKKVGYFCGMDFASKDIYDFKEYVSRYDHSLTTALMTWKFGKEKKSTIAALFHDIATPCFSHVIDYMNGDYKNQESTEEKTAEILKKDKFLAKCLEEDHIQLEEIIDFKKYSIVDLDRPKLCADRLDGIFLTSLYWTKTITIEEIETILKNIEVIENEEKELELSFKKEEIAKNILKHNEKIDCYCHSKEDNYMMDLLSKITKKALEKKLFSYEDLFQKEEFEIVKKIKKSNQKDLLNLWHQFETIKKKEIPIIELPEIKRRKICPLVEKKRITKDE